MSSSIFIASLSLRLPCSRSEHPPSSAAQQTAAISGLVSDQTGASVAGAKVELVSGLVVIRSVVTDRDGRYRFDGLQPGEYTVRVTAPGFQSTERRVNVAASGPRRSPTSGSTCRRWRRASSSRRSG